MRGQAHFDRDRKPISLYEYAELASNDRYTTIGRNDIGPEECVLTVWTGVNLGDDDNDARVFETRIFGGPHDDARFQYRTVEEARRGHVQCVVDRTNYKSPWWLRGVTLRELPPVSVDYWYSPNRGL